MMFSLMDAFCNHACCGTYPAMFGMIHSSSGICDEVPRSPWHWEDFGVGRWSQRGDPPRRGGREEAMSFPSLPGVSMIISS